MTIMKIVNVIRIWNKSFCSRANGLCPQHYFLKIKNGTFALNEYGQRITFSYMVSSASEYNT